MPGGRVLMIAHHFPPMGGSGSNRALAFTRYLPEYGWQPSVLTPAAAWALNRDDSLIREMPSGVRVIRTRSFEPRPLGEVARSAGREAAEHGLSGGEFARRLEGERLRPPGRLRSNLGHLKRFPDAHIGWLPFALAAARRERYDVAYSSSGPFTSHVVGLVLKRSTRRPWVVELRDGWYRWNRAIFPDYPVWRDALERRLEAAAIRVADRVILVTDRMANTYRCQYPDIPSGHFGVVPNGFDPAQFDTTPPPPRGDGAWELLHAGALYYGRSLATLLGAVRRLINTDADFARDFRLTLIGTLDPAARAEIQQGGPGDRLHARGLLSHDEALYTMRNANALLLVANTTPGAEATVPGKLFEYLAVGRPILAVAPPDSATADVLQETHTGWLAAPDDVDAIACALQRAYRQQLTSASRTDIARFDRRVLAGDLARIFDQVAPGAARRT